MKDAREIQRALSAPFPPSVLGWKPQSVKGDRALACAFIDARDVMDRLDEVLGVENWEDSYTVLAGGSVACRLTVRVGPAMITKEDVGSPSDQPDAGDKLKAAYSDALKRAAVKYGIGRYLYSLPMQWCPFDPNKRQFTQLPQLPAKFLPAPASREAAPKPEGGQHRAPAPEKEDKPDPLAAALQEEIKRLKKGWFECMTWLNAHTKVAGASPGYTGATRFHEIPREHVAALVAELRKQPAA
jgi:hypothetical protein